MAAGPMTVSIPKVTVCFENDPDLFKHVLWFDFYWRIVELANNAARAHGDGFSVLFRSSQEISHAQGLPLASIQWRGKTVLLLSRPSHIGIDVVLKKTDTDTIATYFDREDWQSKPADVLAPILLGHLEWRVYKAQKDLEEAIAAREAYAYMYDQF